MLRFVKICEKPKKLQRMTGVTVEQFNLLATRLKPTWEQAERERLLERERQRAIGQGRKYKLATIEDKLLLVLVFYRFYLTDELMGWIFGLDASNVNRMRKKIEPLVEKGADPKLGLPVRQKIPPRAKKISRWEELVKVCPDFADVITDATEQTRQRPDKRVQKKYYSGKKRRHTIKTQITINTTGKVLIVSRSYPGRRHDYQIFKKEGTAQKLPQSSRHYVDRGYDGAQNDYQQYKILLPFKKRRNHRTLTPTEKRSNKKHSKIRILVEHVLSRMKKYQILAQVYRHKVKDYNQRFRNIAALINFRLATAQT